MRIRLACLALLLAFAGFPACGDDDLKFGEPNDTPTPDRTSTPDATETPTPTPTETPEP